MNATVEDLTSNFLLAVAYLSDMRSAVLNDRLAVTKGAMGKLGGHDADALEKSLAD